MSKEKTQKELQKLREKFAKSNSAKKKNENEFFKKKKRDR